MEGSRRVVIGAQGAPIGVLTAGSGPALLLVHGGVGQIERWQPMWGSLAERWQVTAMDRRGRGSSGDSSPYSISHEYDDIVVVSSRLAEETGGLIDVFGHSYGATCTIGAAGRGAPFRRVVLYEPPGPETVTREFVDRLDAMVAEGKPGRAMVAFLTEIIGLSSAEVDDLKNTPPAYDILGVLSATLPREGRALLELTLPALASGVSCPAMLLVGETSPRWAHHITASVAEAMEDPNVVPLPGLGHEAIDKAPDLIVSYLERFLRGCESTSDPVGLSAAGSDRVLGRSEGS